MSWDVEVLPVEDAELLYRRILNWHIKSDGSISSAAFKDRKGRPDNSISVELASLTTPQECAARPGRPGFSVISLTAREPRSLDLTVRHDPLPDNYAHALIEGENSQSKCEKLARAAIICLTASAG